MHPADVPGSVLHRAAALGDLPVHRHMATAFTGLIHPNNWNDIDQWFRTNLTYETDEMFQPYIQGHL